MAQDYGVDEALKKLGIKDVNNGMCTGTVWEETSGDLINSYSPVDGEKIAGIKQSTKKDYHKVITTAGDAFKKWRKIPAPVRGEVVRQIGNELRKYKEPLGKLVSYEMGKILQEGLGEVQEMIDIEMADQIFQLSHRERVFVNFPYIKKDTGLFDEPSGLIALLVRAV